MPAGRSWELIARNLFAGPNWRGLVRAFAVYEQPGRSLWRYVTERGAYPWTCAVRTPAGTLRPELHSAQDLITVNEIFCREDYPAGGALRTVVDVGSNIGISALYFLSRSSAATVRCFEPLPRNVERLRQNLQPFAGRWTVEPVAVDAAGGEAMFGDDPSGRYGALGRSSPTAFPVRVRAIADVLDEALAETGHIDVLKVDTEGAELRTVQAIRPDQLDRIGTIYFEWLGDDEPPHRDRFAATVRCDTVALRQRR